jgi:hypothetical protein
MPVARDYCEKRRRSDQVRLRNGSGGRAEDRDEHRARPRGVFPGDLSAVPEAEQGERDAREEAPRSDEPRDHDAVLESGDFVQVRQTDAAEVPAASLLGLCQDLRAAVSLPVSS